ncbi:MAG TPA: hypothetical protein VF712_18585 [Thermoleophilaceae bacterium]|jgi:hypothetical protein
MSKGQDERPEDQQAKEAGKEKDGKRTPERTDQPQAKTSSPAPELAEQPAEAASAETASRSRAGGYPRLHPVPAGQDFVFARWEEIIAEKPPWWTRPDGVGLRLRLAEPGELALARRAGGIARQAVAKLVGETRTALLAEDGYFARRYGAALAEIRRIREDASETWVPEAVGPSIFAAALGLLSKRDYLPQLVDDLAADAEGVGDIDDFVRLEALVELLDAELVYEGHSLAWRRTVLEDAKRRRSDGADLAAAIKGALAENWHAKQRSFDVLIPVDEFAEPPGGRAGFFPVPPNQAIAEIIRPWDVDGVDEILGHSALERAAVVLRYDPTGVTAVDMHAAGRAVSRRFERDADLWRLREGRVADATVAYIYDRDAARAEVVSLPPEPLDLLPSSLGSYEASPDAEEREATVVDDALLQLAQSRTATPATALVNLWTAAEALFAGAVEDVRGDAGPVMAGLAELLYLRDLLAWLGERYVAAEVDGHADAPRPTTSRWGLERTLVKTTELLNRLVENGDALAWYRLKLITRWTTGPSFGTQMTAFSKRLEGVSARAYLIRNFFIHRAHIRAIAIDVTLPPFAGLVRECIGFVATGGPPDETLRTAKTATLEVRHTAKKIADGEAQAPDALWDLLPSAPGAVDVGEPPDTDPTEEAGSEPPPVAAPEPTDVPVEDLPAAEPEDPPEE